MEFKSNQRMFAYSQDVCDSKALWTCLIFYFVKKKIKPPLYIVFIKQMKRTHIFSGCWADIEHF